MKKSGIEFSTYTGCSKAAETRLGRALRRGLAVEVSCNNEEYPDLTCLKHVCEPIETIEELATKLPSLDVLRKAQCIGPGSVEIIHRTLVANGYPGIPGYIGKNSMMTYTMSVECTGAQLECLMAYAKSLGVSLKFSD